MYNKIPFTPMSFVLSEITNTMNRAVRTELNNQCPSSLKWPNHQMQFIETKNNSTCTNAKWFYLKSVSIFDFLSIIHISCIYFFTRRYWYCVRFISGHIQFIFIPEMFTVSNLVKILKHILKLIPALSSSTHFEFSLKITSHIEHQQTFNTSQKKLFDESANKNSQLHSKNPEQISVGWKSDNECKFRRWADTFYSLDN